LVPGRTFLLVAGGGWGWGSGKDGETESEREKRRRKRTTKGKGKKLKKKGFHFFCFFFRFPLEENTMDDASDAAPLLASLRERAAELEAAVRLVRLLRF